MKKILLNVIFFLSLTVCVASPGWAGGLDDFKAGEAALQAGNDDAAIRLLTTAIGSGELDRERLKTAYKLRGNAWINKGNKGYYDYDKGYYDRAIDDYTKAIEIDPNFAVAYYNRGIAWYKKRDYDKAIAEYTKAIAEYSKASEIDPKSKYVEAYINRSIAWREKGDYDKAIADCTKAIEIKPRHAGAYNSRGVAWHAKGDYDKAIADFTKALEINPKYADAYYNRGLAWGKKGNYDKAIADYTKAIELDPKYASAYNGLAWLMATCPEGKYRNGKRAVEFAKKAVALKDEAGFLDTLAASYAEAGRFQEAIKTQERAITKLKQAGGTKELPEYEEHLSSYKAGKPWRAKRG